MAVAERRPRQDPPEDRKLCPCGEAFWRARWESRRSFAERKFCSSGCAGRLRRKLLYASLSRVGVWVGVLLLGLTACGSTDAQGTFASPLRVEQIDRDTWHLLRDLCYQSPAHGLVIVPKGFITDFATVPRWVPIAYAVAAGTGQPAAVLHDYLYQTHWVSRPAADREFERALAAVHEPWWRRKLMYAAVVIFGGPAWASGPGRYQEYRNFRWSAFPSSCTAT